MSIPRHRCSAPGCQCSVPVHMLMCRAHWKRVPYKLRGDVAEAWDRFRWGQITKAELLAVQARATEALTAAVKGGAA